MRAHVIGFVVTVTAASLVACGSAPEEGKQPGDEQGKDRIGTASEALTSSGIGQFQSASGWCIHPVSGTSPPNLPPAGTGLKLDACNNSGGFWAFSQGVSSDAVFDGSQGTLVMGNLCLEADYTSGNVQLNPCNHKETQEWTWQQGKLQPPSQLGKCITSSGTGSGSTISLQNCSAEASGQQSFLPIDFNLMFASGIGASSQYNGPHPPYTPPHVPSSARSNFQCLDVFLDLETLANDPVDDFQCNATNAQWLHFDDANHLLTTAGTCVTASSAAQGAPVQVAACNGSPTQQWIYLNSQFWNVAGGEFLPIYCLDVQGESNAPATQVTLSSCQFGTAPLAGQTWAGNLIWPKVQKLVFNSKYFDDQEENAHATLTLYNNGNWEYSGNIHDYGAGADNVAMDAFPTTLPAGSHGPLFVVTGNVYGTFESGSRDLNWDMTGLDTEITTNWSSIVSGGITFHFYVSTDFGSDFLGIGKDVGIAALALLGGSACVHNGARVSAYGDSDRSTVYVDCTGG